MLTFETATAYALTKMAEWGVASPVLASIVNAHTDGDCQPVILADFVDANGDAFRWDIWLENGAIYGEC